MAANLEDKVEGLFAHPVTTLDLEVALALVVLGVLAGMFLRMRGDIHGLRAAFITGVAAFAGAWLTHHARLAHLIGVRPGLWEMVVPAIFAGVAGAPFSKTGRIPFASLGWFLWWGAAVRGSYFLLSLYHRLR
ncbi:MAG: hypothetical protein ACYC8T_16645 [Myxococcaceae bacterium]